MPGVIPAFSSEAGHREPKNSLAQWVLFVPIRDLRHLAVLRRIASLPSSGRAAAITYSESHGTLYHSWNCNPWRHPWRA